MQIWPKKYTSQFETILDVLSYKRLHSQQINEIFTNDLSKGIHVISLLPTYSN